MVIALQVLSLCEAIELPKRNIIPLEGEKCPKGYEQNPDNPKQCRKKVSLLRTAVGGYNVHSGVNMVADAVKSMQKKKKLGLLNTIKLGVGAGLAYQGARDVKQGLGYA